MSKAKIRIRIEGTARQRGSKVAIPLRNGKIAMKDSAKGSREWMLHVTASAAEQYAGDPLLGPVRLIVQVYLARPKAHYGTGRNAGRLKASAPQWHSQTPDLSKLVRGIEDGLSKVVYADDRQIAAIEASKKWSAGQPHVVVDV